MPRYVAFMRGINVGKAKRIAMAELRAMAVGLGFCEVATVLNSGNLIFNTRATAEAKLSAAIKAAIAATCGVDCAVMVIKAELLRKIVEDNPLPQALANPPYFLVAFAQDHKALMHAEALAETVWHPDQIAITANAIYLWCDTGVLDSPLNKAFGKRMGDKVTARNWATLDKVCALL